MKPTKMRNSQIYRAANAARSSQASSPLSKGLQGRYAKKSVRVVAGDAVRAVRGEYKGVDGRVARVDTATGKVAIEGIKKEKTRGDKYDVLIHASNLVVTDLNPDDRWRMKKIKGEKGTSHTLAPSEPEAGDSGGRVYLGIPESGTKDPWSEQTRSEPAPGQEAEPEQRDEHRAIDGTDVASQEKWPEPEQRDEYRPTDDADATVEGSEPAPGQEAEPEQRDEYRPTDDADATVKEGSEPAPGQEAEPEQRDEYRPTDDADATVKEGSEPAPRQEAEPEQTKDEERPREREE